MGRWKGLFQKFVAQLRIQSKHAENDPDGKGIKLKLWSSQRIVLEQIADALDHGVHIIYVLKSRQLGITTIALAIILFWLALHPNTIGIYVADSDANAEKGRQTIRKYVQSLANFMSKSFSITKFAKHMVGFSNGSRLDIRVAGKTKANWGEGEGYLVGLLTEVAKFGQVSGLDNFRHAMAPQNPRSLYIYESTANGPNHWRDMWQEAQDDPTTIQSIFVGWWANETNILREGTPQYARYAGVGPDPKENDHIKTVKDMYGVDIRLGQLAWKRWNDAHTKSGEGDIDQNQPWYPAQAFVESGVSFFSTKLVSDRLSYIADAPPVLVEDNGFAFWPYRFLLGTEYHLSSVEYLGPIAKDIDEVTLRIWEKPVDGAQYVIGFDPAFGRTDFGNNHAASVWRCFADKLVQVAEYAENEVSTVQACWALAWLAGRYYPCTINIDLAGGLGLVVMQEFQNLRTRMSSDWYRDRIGKEFEDFLSAASWYMYHRADSPGPGYMYGTKTSHDIKFKMMNQLRDSFITNLLEIRSVPLLREMLTVRQTGPDIGAAAQGRDKDDRTFAMALANLTWVEFIRPYQISQAITWESSIAAESGEATTTSVRMNRMIQSLLISANEEPDYPALAEYLEARNLL